MIKYNTKRLPYIAAAFLMISTISLSLTSCGSPADSNDIGKAPAVGAEGTDEEKTTPAETTSGGKQQVTIRVADMAAWNNAYFEYGEDRGLLDSFFENDKYDIEFKIDSFANGPAEIEAFAAGELDFASMGSMPATTGASSDFGFKIVGVNAVTTSFGNVVVLADSEINSVQELKGKKVGTIFGGTLHYYAGRFLEDSGLSYDDVEFINVGNEAATSLRAGEIDAGVISDSLTVELTNEGTVRVIANKMNGVVGFSEVCIADRIINDYDGLAAVLLKGFDDLYRYIDANSDDYLDYLGGLTGVDISSVKATWNNSDHKVSSLDDEVIYSNAEELLVWMQAQDLVENTAVKFEEIIDRSVAREAGIN